MEGAFTVYSNGNTLILSVSAFGGFTSIGRETRNSTFGSVVFCMPTHQKSSFGRQMEHSLRTIKPFLTAKYTSDLHLFA